MKLLDDAGIAKPHIMAARLINRTHATDVLLRGRNKRGEEVRARELRRRYSLSLKHYPFARPSRA